MTNRNPVKQWEITFPKVIPSVTKDTFHTYFPPAEYSICCLEEHKDGTPHLHLGIKLIKGITHAKLIKWLEAKFPDDWKRIHVSPIRSWDHFNDYCKKEDPTPFLQGQLEKKKTKLQKEMEELFAQAKKETDYIKWKAGLEEARAKDYKSYELELELLLKRQRIRNYFNSLEWDEMSMGSKESAMHEAFSDADLLQNF